MLLLECLWWDKFTLYSILRLGGPPKKNNYVMLCGLQPKRSILSAQWIFA